VKDKLKQGIIACWVLCVSSLSLLAQQDDTVGREVTRQDWLNYMPVFVGAIIIVIIVDAFFIVPIFRKSANDKHEQEQ